MEEIGIGLLTIKIIIGFATLFLILTLTGKVSINELSPYHLVFVLVLGDFLGESLYENKLSLFHFLYAIGLWTGLMLLIEFITEKKKAARRLLEGSPSIIIRDGILDREMMKKNKLDLNEVASLLRQRDVFSVREVKYGILEENGEISVLLKSKYDQPKIEEILNLNIATKKRYLPVSLIVDGEILSNNLQEFGLSRDWLINELQKKGHHDEKTIFYADWLEGDGLHISPK